MKHLLFCLLLLIVSSAVSNAQSLAINITGAVANASSILDVSSTTKGILVSRMTKAQKNVITTTTIPLLYQHLLVLHHLQLHYLRLQPATEENT